MHAASIDPIDLRFREGHGAEMLKALPKLTRKNVFPLILGRDCSGEVVAVGDEVMSFKPGDQVYGALSIARQGTHTQLAVFREGELALKPTNLNHKEASSLPWVTNTVWTPLVHHAGLTRTAACNKKVVVHAETGGVGSFAIQLLKALGCSRHNHLLSGEHPVGTPTGG